jgi:hypothetical protein
MRTFGILVLVMLALLVTDAFVFDGRYRAQAWHEAQLMGSRINTYIAHQLRSMGLRG